jgi:cytidylate kinase
LIQEKTKMPVIAMTQEMGSLAKDVEHKLAQALNLQQMTNEVVEHVAGKMHVPSSLINRMREGQAGLVERFTTDTQCLALYTAEEVFNFANKGDVVIRGWGSTCLLRPVQHVVCVRITRSFEKRVEWLMDNVETHNQSFAEAEIRRSDAAHASRMYEQFGVSWGDPILYDLVLNTDRLSVDSCVEQIKLLVSRPEFQATAESRAILANMTLEAQIRAEMKDHAATRNTNVTVESNGGVVTLRGIVFSKPELEETETITSEVPGVNRVVNELRVMVNSRFHSSIKSK